MNGKQDAQTSVPFRFGITPGDTFEVSGTINLHGGIPTSARMFAYNHEEMTQEQWIAEIERRFASIGYPCRVIDEIHAGNGHYSFTLGTQ